jgi:hypothetical protein
MKCSKFIPFQSDGFQLTLSPPLNCLYQKSSLSSLVEIESFDSLVANVVFELRKLCLKRIMEEVNNLLRLCHRLCRREDQQQHQAKRLRREDEGYTAWKYTEIFDLSLDGFIKVHKATQTNTPTDDTFFTQW